MLDKIINYSFYTLFFLTPLFWTSLNYELFEYNKMILTYGLTVLIVGAWVLKMVTQKTLIFKKTPLDIPFLLFLIANILSTFFSIDPHTSVWGYYSRSNGGLLSLISYLLLYYAFVSNLAASQVKNILKIGILSGFLISLWAIFEHFGVSLSCVLLRGEFNDGCWIQDVQARVFASLGQPNWLAAYLSMLIFPSLYFLITSENFKERITYYICAITMYLAFTFTYSRGPTLGLIAGLGVFLIGYLTNFRITISNLKSKFQTSNFKLITPILISFLIVNILFGSALTSFRLVSKFAAPIRPGITLPSTPSVGTQLENGGTESGQIRFIVWMGALEIFKHYPIFGSGLETFAYSYYQFRPISHNLTSEWDFLYNKAHNEYLNYLATTGIVGIGTYLLLIGTFVVWSIKKFLESSRQTLNSRLLILTTLAAYVSYLVYNFFLFSVVIIAIFFYIFPSLVFVATESVKVVKFPKRFSKFSQAFTSLIYKNPSSTKITIGIIIAVCFYMQFSVYKLWLADTYFNKGQKASDAGSAGQAYNLLSEATDLNKGEPFYRSELAYSAAAAASVLKEVDATLSAALKDESILQLQKTLEISPKNVSFWRTAIRTYFELSSLDQIYTQKTLEAIDKTIALAPTDPKLYFNKALILGSIGKVDEEIKYLKQALDLKPNYLEALAQLKEATESAKGKR